MLPPLPSKTLIAGRYEIDRVAGRGGMGIVYRALDRYTDEWVALKVLRNSAGNHLAPQRFSREMQILSELHHPSIVSHLASGQTAEGLEYLVMEWLEGEELTDRMNRGALSVYEARQLLLQVGGALACAHLLGVVHRDIKPSNLFLCNKEFDRVILLDFGVAYHRRPITQTALTQIGTVIGTLAYMSPEQARADESITAAADIYSLGRVIYQGLSGQKRREPEHLAAALAQAIFDESPPLARICPWIPEPLAELVTRMLSKDPARRPADGTVLLGELAPLGPLPGMDLPPADDGRGVGSELSDEQSLYTVVLAVSGDGAVPSLVSEGAKLHPDMEERQLLEATLVSHHATPRWLLDGSLLLTMALSDSAHDQALRAARCALIIKARWPGTAIAVTTGRGQIARQELLGEVVDRAARLLRERERLTLANPRAEAIKSGSIWVDELSASLLDRRFVLVPVQGAALLTGEPLASEETRSVLGTIPPCMGREVELTILETLVKRCRDDSEPQAVLITGPPGSGKTRLRQEFLNRLRRRSWPWTAMLGVGEILSAGAPYALLGQALRQLCAIPLGDSQAAARQRLTSRCTALLGTEEGERVALFLGELCGLPFPGGDPPELRAARGDSNALSAHLLHAFTTVIGACCDHTPVILILDDLHWADALSIQLVDRALRELQGRPFMVMALGRAEVKTAFPKVQQWPHVKELPLDGLSRAASERIVRFVLGSVIESSTMAHIIQHAGGNALLLEELIRAESESQGSHVSATVLAILQARMQRLEPRARLVLGQASIFGQRFWRGGLQSIREAAPFDLEVDVVLQSLVQAELITAHKQSYFAGECEYSFRHALMREAAYSLLREDQKQHWHRVAGQYLERLGEPKDLVLAEHFRRSDERSRCIPYYTRVARRTLDGNDLAGARGYANWALDAKPEGEARGELLSIQAAILYRSQDHKESIRAGQEALRLLPPGCVNWCRTVHSLLIAFISTGAREAMGELAGRFLATAPSRDSMAAYVETGGVLLSLFCLTGQNQACQSLIARLETMSAGILDQEAGVKLWLRFGQSNWMRLLQGDPWSAWRYGEDAVAAAVQSGNRRWLGVAQGDAALAELELGSPAGEAKLREALSTLRGIEEEVTADYTAIGMALWLSERAERETEAAELAQGVHRRTKDNAYFQGIACWTQSRLHAAAGAWDAAETAARDGLLALKAMPPLRLGLLAQLLRVLLGAGQLEAARAVEDEARMALQALGGVGFRDQSLRLAIIEVRLAAGDHEGGTAELRTALSFLRERAALIAHPMWRQHYCENIRENIKLRTLGRELLGEELDILVRLPTLP